LILGVLKENLIRTHKLTKVHSLKTTWPKNPMMITKHARKVEAKVLPQGDGSVNEQSWGRT
jgi:hypothetical protein